MALFYLNYKEHCFKLCKQNKFSILEKKFKIQDMLSAKEVFVTSASSFVTPVIKVNETLINNGVVGEFSYELRKLYLDLYN